MNQNNTRTAVDGAADETVVALAAGVGTAITGSDVTHVIFILDGSGSMGGQEADVIGGVNAYIDGLRGSGATGEVGVSYLLFDNHLRLVWNDLRLADVPRLDASTYFVRGGTALLDAVGTTVSAVNNNPAHRYIVITHTDGEENSSREWTAERVRALIAEREALGNWTFTFFGEGIDAWGAARAMGFSQDSTASYSSARRVESYVAKARVSNMMRERNMRSTRRFGSATERAMDDPKVSDDELAAILESEETTNS